MKESASMSHIQGSAKENVQTMDGERCDERRLRNSKNKKLCAFLGLRGQMNGDLRASEPYKLRFAP